MPATTIARPTVAEVAASAASADAPRPALGPLAADVEQRVVDADGEADQDHDRSRRRAVGRDLRDEPERAERRADRGQAEQQRHRRGDERAEGEHQDQQRDRKRDQLGAVQPVVDELIDRVVLRPAAGLIEGDAGLARGQSVDEVLHRGGAAVGVVGIAAQRHDDERGSAARARQLGRAVGAVDRLHRRQAAGAGLERRDRVRGPLRTARADEHVLGRGAIEARGGAAGRRPGPTHRCPSRSSTACACRHSSRGLRTRRSARARARRSSLGDAPRSGPRRGRSGRARRSLPAGPSQPNPPTRRMWWMKV